jgi:small-conductance mechanosensitive channel
MSDEDEKPEGTSIEVGGIKFTGGKLFVVLTALSTAAGSLWAGFEVYQQFLTMKEVTETYASMGDEFNKMKERQDSNERMIRMNLETTKYLSDNLASLSSSLGSSVMSARQTVDAVTARTQVSERETLQSQRAIINELRAQDNEQQRRIKDLEKQVDERITKTLANPLAGRD